MQIFSFVQPWCWHYIYKFSVCLRSDVLKWICVGFFSAQRILGSFDSIVMVPFYVLPTHDAVLDQGRWKLNCFIELIPTLKRTILGCVSSSYWCFKQNELPTPVVLFFIRVFLFLLPTRGTSHLSQVALSFQFWIKLFAQYIVYMRACVLWSCECNFSVLRVLLLKKFQEKCL